MAVSLRRGKYYPSTRYTPAGCEEQNRTNWRLGIDRIEYRSTQHDASAQSATVPPEVLAVRQPRIDKNRSDKEAIQGVSAGVYHDPRRVFSTTQASDYHLGTTVKSDKYARLGPAFDRLSANKTNYELAAPETSRRALQPASHEHFLDPRHRTPVQQARIGGWRNAEGAYCATEKDKEAVLRGGGGGQGCLGVDFNIVTNQREHAAHSKALMRTGPRMSLNKYNPVNSGADRFGGQAKTIDIISGRTSNAPIAPPQPQPSQLRRPNEPILRTRPW